MEHQIGRKRARRPMLKSLATMVVPSNVEIEEVLARKSTGVNERAETYTEDSIGPMISRMSSVVRREAGDDVRDKGVIPGPVGSRA